MASIDTACLEDIMEIRNEAHIPARKYFSNDIAVLTCSNTSGQLLKVLRLTLLTTFIPSGMTQSFNQTKKTQLRS